MTWHKTSSHSRGYGWAWQKKRKRILERDNYLCQCKYCKVECRVTPANEVDHVVSKAKANSLGWTSAMIEDDSNLAAINHACHVRKSLEETGANPRPVIGLDGWPV